MNTLYSTFTNFFIKPEEKLPENEISKKIDGSLKTYVNVCIYICFYEAFSYFV